MREKLYHQITTDSDYLALGKQEQQIISGGLKRITCQSVSMTTNKPSDIIDICHSYSLRLELKIIP